jgi:ATP-binding cassette, subfamily B, bacterial
MSPPHQALPLRQLPSTVPAALALVWRAAPRLLLLSVVLRVLTAFVIALVLIGAQGSMTASGASAEDISPSDLVAPVAILLLMLILAPLAAVAGREVRDILTAEVERAAQDRVLAVASSVSLRDLDDAVFHDRLTRASASARTRPMQLVDALLSLVASSAGVVAIGVALMLIRPWLVPVVGAATVPLVIAIVRSGAVVHGFTWTMTAAERQRDYLYQLLTTTVAAKEVRAFGIAEHLRGRHASLHGDHIVALRAASKRQLQLSLKGTFAATSLVSIAVGVLLWLAVTKAITPIEAAVSVLAVLLFAERVFSGVTAAGLLLESARFMDDLRSFELAAAPTRIRPSARVPTEFSELRVEDVSFAYPSSDRLVLHGVSFTIRAGEVVALVGANGSGKSTLAKLLAHLYLPSGGQIRWDGVDVTTVDGDSLRGSVAIVCQDFQRYALSARDNIGLGQSDRIDDLGSILLAASAAGVHDTLAALPSGYDTVLAPEFPAGVDLSIGQWQRVALARALFRNAPFLILDEPSAAQDARAEREIFEEARSLARGRTVLLVSHRLSTVLSADRIVVLERGTIVEMGTHEALLERRGPYWRLFAQQEPKSIGTVRRDGYSPNRPRYEPARY